MIVPGVSQAADVQTHHLTGRDHLGTSAAATAGSGCTVGGSGGRFVRPVPGRDRCRSRSPSRLGAWVPQAWTGPSEGWRPVKRGRGGTVIALSLVAIVLLVVVVRVIIDTLQYSQSASGDPAQALQSA